MDNRESILDVALKLFADKGYDAVGVQEVVDAAGITKPTLYHYFGSKYGLLEAILDTGFGRLMDKVSGPMNSSDSDVRERLFNVAKAFLTFAVDDGIFFSFMLSLMYSPRSSDSYKAVKPHLLNLYQNVIDMFMRASDQLGNMNGRQEQFAMGFLGLLNQYAYTYSEKTPVMDEELKNHVTDGDIRALIQQYMYGIVN
jgi:AcrR family transcriptional regulator